MVLLVDVSRSLHWAASPADGSVRESDVPDPQEKRRALRNVGQRCVLSQ